MRLTVLGGCGAWPAAGQACSGYLVEHDGFRLLVDPGYATLPRLLEQLNAAMNAALIVLARIFLALIVSPPLAAPPAPAVAAC